MLKNYTDEKNVQVILALLKEHSIRKVIASPGMKNVALVASMQSDSYFTMYSAVDERSAAYMACGLATESGEPVVLSCTGATAPRNYLPGLTEAYYRKLPVLAITSCESQSRIGHHIAQDIDQRTMPNDVARYSVTLPIVKDQDDLWDCEIKVNRAILELTRHGGGPVHINLPTTHSGNYNVKELPQFRVINRITPSDEFPKLLEGKIAIFIGAHKAMSTEQIESIEGFCLANDAVVFCDHTSNYKGKNRILYSLVAGQQMFDKAKYQPDLLIHIGEVTGDYYTLKIGARQVWRVSEDGEIRDIFRKMRYVFEMPEQIFFKHYTKKQKNDGYFKLCKSHLDALYEMTPELPFSNIWIASQLAQRIPHDSVIHFGILNSLRSWNFFEIPTAVSSMANVGGFGIDGGLSALVGASLANETKLYFGVIGDLAFFYDLNVLGNRHIGNNLRIILINNGKGTEFRNYAHRAEHFGDDADEYIAAARHFGNKSRSLIKNYAIDLGFEYMSASDKQEFNTMYERFLTKEITKKSILFEIFTDSANESKALEKMMNIEDNFKGIAKRMTKKILGYEGQKLIKNIIKR